MAALPSDALEFFNVKAPLAVPVVKIKSPSVALDMVSPFPNVISFPVTVKISAQRCCTSSNCNSIICLV